MARKDILYIRQQQPVAGIYERVCVYNTWKKLLVHAQLLLPDVYTYMYCESISSYTSLQRSFTRRRRVRDMTLFCSQSEDHLFAGRRVLYDGFHSWERDRVYISIAATAEGSLLSPCSNGVTLRNCLEPCIKYFLGARRRKSRVNSFMAYFFFSLSLSCWQSHDEIDCIFIGRVL